jgi:hypothetical protein
MPDKTSQLSELVVCRQRASDLPASAPRHAGTGHRRLVGKDVHGATPVEVGLGVLEPGGMAEHHGHAAQEHAMDGLVERSVAVSSSVQEVVEPGTPWHRRLRCCPRATAPAALLVILPYPVRRRVSSPRVATRRSPDASPVHSGGCGRTPGGIPQCARRSSVAEREQHTAMEGVAALLR